MYSEDIRKEGGGVVTTETAGDLFGEIVSTPATVPEGGTLRDAVQALIASGITRKAYVIDDERRLKGTITIETLMRHVGYRMGARAPGVISWFRFIRDMESDEVSKFMARPVPVTRETTIREVIRRVVEEHLNDFPIVDGDGRLIGEVNTFNLLKATQGVFSAAGGDLPAGESSG